MKIAIILIASAFITAGISGVFGMAGGLIFLGIIATFLTVAEAMVVHGAVQSVSNCYRAYLLRGGLRWDILAWQALGAIPMTALLLWASVSLNKGQLFLALGVLPLFLWLPKGWLQGDVEKPPHAVLCGAMVMGLNLTAGVAGPALDFFYVKTALTRHEIVATKALTMFASHIVKILYFGIPLFLASDLAGLPPLWIFLACIPAVMMGTFLGTQLLKRFSDVGFRSVTRTLVTVIGFIYFLRGLILVGVL
jgi:uncharacterized membrane protein YfcA